MTTESVCSVVPYDEADAATAHSISTRLHPLDVGYDPRRYAMDCELPPGEHLVVSYDQSPDGDGPQPVMVASGPRAEVADLLRQAG